MSDQEIGKRRARRRPALELPRLLSVTEVAAVFGRGRRWVQTRVRNGELEAYRDKGGLMIVKASIQAYLERCRLVVVRPPVPTVATVATAASAPEGNPKDEHGSEPHPGPAAGAAGGTGG